MTSFNFDDYVDETFRYDKSDGEGQDEADIARRKNKELLLRVGSRLLEEVQFDMNDFCDDDIRDVLFKTEEEAYLFYNEYAKYKGFSVRKDTMHKRNGEPCRRRFVCSCAGERSAKWLRIYKRQITPRRISRSNCPALLSISYSEALKRWVVVNFFDAHNHVLAPLEKSQFLRSHRKVSITDASFSQQLCGLGVAKKKIVDIIVAKAGGHENAGCTTLDFYNEMNRARVARVLAGDANAVLSYMDKMCVHDPQFFMKHEVAANSQLLKLFWADSQSQEDYKLFGDLLLFDSTYRTNRYDMPLVVFAGVNNHRHTVVFAFAVMNSETTESYVWVLETFLSAMDNVQPKSVITDGDPAIRKAIETVLPRSKHRLCVWHIVQNSLTHVHTEGFHKDFVEAMFCSGPPENFERKWAALLKKYKNVAKKKWVKDIYLKKEYWAESYLREHFFAGCRSNQRCESINSVIRRCARRGLTLIELIEKLDVNVQHIRHRDLEAEVSTFTTKSALVPNLSCIGEQAEALYTRAGYKYFYNQLMHEPMYVVNETYEEDGGRIIRYLVNRHLHPNSPSTVEYLGSDDSFRCSCKLFERVGFVCRHILAVLKHTHVAELPQSCILHRWTRNARSYAVKAGVVLPSSSLGFGIRLKDLETGASELFRWASESRERCLKVISYINSLKTDLLAEAVPQAPDQEKPIGSEEGLASTPTHVGLPPDPIVDPPRGRPKRLAKRKIWQRINRKCGICKVVGHTRATCPCILSEDENDEANSNEQGPEEGEAEADPDAATNEPDETMGPSAYVAEEVRSTRRKITCSICHVVGHRRDHCPGILASEDTSGVVDLGLAYMHRQGDGSIYWSLKED